MADQDVTQAVGQAKLSTNQASTVASTVASEDESQKDLLVRLGSTATLWHDADNEGYATIQVRGHNENHRLRSKAFKLWLIQQYYRERNGAPGSQATQDALATLEAKSVFDGAEWTPSVRLASHDHCVYVDLGDEDWRAIEISADGWKVISDPPVKFIRPRGMRTLPIPERGGSLDVVRDLLNFRSEDDFKILVGWLIAAFRPTGPYTVLVLNGEQGSAKTSTAKAFRRLIDPNIAETRTIPREERDLLIAAKNGWIVSIDNLSEVRPWLSDSICRLATGGGFGARQLYTDGEEYLFEAQRPVIINGIPDLATRPDLADRSLVLILPTISKKERLPSSTFWQQFEKASPGILGAILDAVVTALKYEIKTRDSILQEGKSLPRMADAAIWVEAAASTLRWESGDYLSAFISNQAEIQRHITHAEIVATAIHRLMESREVWEGNSTDLLEALKATNPDDVQRVKEWPKAANSLSGKLRRAAPGLRMTGIEVSERTLDGKTIWTLTKNKLEKDPTDRTDRTSQASDKGDKWDKWDDLQHQSNQIDPESAYECDERLSIQSDSEADPDDPSTYIDDSDFPLSPETREGNRFLGAEPIPPIFDRRLRVSATKRKD